ncbi:MAG: CehA/McbA family metallohydrolase [Isosphaerales bacterium]
MRASLRSFRLRHVTWAVVLWGAAHSTSRAEDLPVYLDVEFQPLSAQVKRVIDALEMLGQPLARDEKARLESALDSTGPESAIRTIQNVLDKHCLVGIEINAESRVKSSQGPAPPRLVQSGWSVFLVKVHNQAGVTAELAAGSPNAAPLYRRSTGRPDPKKSIRPSEIIQRWADVIMYQDRPLQRALSGLSIEYRIVQIHSRDAGKREAKISFDVGQGTQDLGFRSDVDILFTCEPAVALIFDVRDEDGRPTMGSFIFRDRLGRVYPSPARRLAPDFFFHPQVYRQSGETVMLPPGTYQVEFTRGPEYLVQSRSITVPASRTHRESFRLKRWINLAKMDWFSGDHHVHAAGCAHYESPTEGVKPEDMWRHILGEDLDVGCVLSWGPCWYAQKQFFNGKIHPLSTSDYLMRYDVEVSGFPSSYAGHLCLLRLKEDDYPNTTRIEEWPSWDLPVLKWGKSQGAVVGFSHSGWGLKIAADKPPSDEIPPFDGIGANEYIVDVVHDAVDFISSVDTPAPWELNIWYHTLNCGFRARLSGETDFPCIYGERVGLGRVYVKLADGHLDFDKWCEGIKQGRSYVSDGHSHLIDFQVNDRGVGEHGSELKLEAPASVKVTAQVAAHLEPNVSAEARAIHDRPLDQKPYWDLERARIGDTRKVPVEVVVNGESVAQTEVSADGSIQGVSFDVPIKKSSWVALRIYPSSHTNPVFVSVGGKPIRASKKSAEWCLRSVDQCWSKKEPAIRAAEKEDAKKAYDVARNAYKKILGESEGD